MPTSRSITAFGERRFRSSRSWRASVARFSSRSVRTRSLTDTLGVDLPDDVLDVGLVELEVADGRERRDGGRQPRRARLVATERERLARALDADDARAVHLERLAGLLEVDDEHTLSTVTLLQRLEVTVVDEPSVVDDQQARAEPLDVVEVVRRE